MQTVVTISGMLAVHAKRAVFTALAGVEGVHAADVELGRAVVEHDGSVSAEALVAAIEAVGFHVVATANVASRALPVVGTVDDPEPR
jgi:copper chaperone CopZ